MVFCVGVCAQGNCCLVPWSSLWPLFSCIAPLILCNPITLDISLFTVRLDGSYFALIDSWMAMQWTSASRVSYGPCLFGLRHSVPTDISAISFVDIIYLSLQKDKTKISSFICYSFIKQNLKLDINSYTANVLPNIWITGPPTATHFTNSRSLKQLFQENSRKVCIILATSSSAIIGGKIFKINYYCW